MSLQCEIVVVGGGIVGTATALALRRAGFDARLLEKSTRSPASSAGPDIDPRVYAITRASAGWLANLSIWQAMPDARRAPILGMKIWDRDPARALHFDVPGVEDEPLGWIVEHGALHVELSGQCSADWVIRGVEVDAVEFGDDAVGLRLSDSSRVQAQLVVGAEGAQSRVREAADIDVVSWAYESEAVVAHLHSATPHQGIAVQRFIPGGAVALLPLHDGRRSLVWSTDRAEAQRLRQVSEAQFCREIEDIFQSEVGAISQPTPRLGFALGLLHARGYVAPRCALVGDSAHVVHPLAGQGLNLGLGDAQALVDTLAMHRDEGRDWSGMRVLRKYQRARMAENTEMLALTDALGRAWSIASPALRQMLSRGLHGVDRAGPLKQLLARRAAGL